MIGVDGIEKGIFELESGQVEHHLHLFPLDNGLHHAELPGIVPYNHQPVPISLPGGFQVFQFAQKEIVHDDDLGRPLRQQAVGQMGADEAGAAGDENGFSLYAGHGGFLLSSGLLHDGRGDLRLAALHGA